MPKANIYNRGLIDEFATWKLGYQILSPYTYRNLKDVLMMFAEFMETEGVNSLLEATPALIIKYRDNLMHHRNSTIRFKIKGLRGFYDWAVVTEKIKNNPYPPIKLPRISRGNEYIPNAPEVFALRRNITSLRMSVIFEVLLSSGLRFNELAQLRCSDVNFDVQVTDLKTQDKSSIVGAAIHVNPHTMLVKRVKERTTFMSKLAAKQLKTYLVRLGLDVKSDLPIFPNLSKESIGTLLNHLVKRTIAREPNSGLKKLLKKKGQTGGSEKLNFMDINVDELTGVPEEYKAAIKKSQDKRREAEEKNPELKKVNRLEIVKPQRLHLHTFRHFFSCLMYYRSYYGTENDIVLVKDLMGHAEMEMTGKYIGSVLVCRHITDWKQIMLGNGFEYINLKY